MTMTDIKCYKELTSWPNFQERLHYLMLYGHVGAATFGFDRWLNQHFYMSKQWKLVREEIIVRDRGCDLGVIGHEIHGKLLVHHLNPIESVDLVHGAGWILDPEYLICTTQMTHNAIHFSDMAQLIPVVADRKPGDTKLW